MEPRVHKKTIFVMAIMLLIVGGIFGGIFGTKAIQSRKSREAMLAQKIPPVTVTAVKAGFQKWEPQLQAVGSLRAVRGIEVTSEIAGLVRSVEFRPGDEVETGRILVKLNADSDIALLHSLEAAAELARIVYDRDRKQYEVQAVSRAALEADEADLKSKRAQVAQQAANVEKKTIRAPFSGRLGISMVNPGQYMSPGDRIVTLQSLEALYIDFYLPQQELSRIAPGQPVVAAIDTYPGQTFSGRITTINPKVESDSRNVQVEATFDNPRHRLLPGMFATVRIQAGQIKRYLTLPQTAVSYNPYGETIYIIEKTGNGPDGKPILSVKPAFVVTGPTRGDQVAIISGIKEGDQVVTSGQLKLKSGSTVVIDNRAQPANDAAPQPVDR